MWGFRSAFASMIVGASAIAGAQSILLSGNSFNQSSGFADALNTLGYSYTFVAPSQYGLTSLTGYNMVYLDGFSQFSPGGANPGLNVQALTDFMNGGGTVMVQNPGFGSEALSLYPFGGDLSATYTYPPGEPSVRITDSANPLNAGLTSTGLSGWGPSAYGLFGASLGGFTGISDNGTDGQWVTVVRGVGKGKLVYTEQGISQRLNAVPSDAQALRFFNNAVPKPVPEPAGMAVLAVGLGFLVTLRRRR